MGTLLVLCGGKDYGGLKPRTQVCIIDQKTHEDGKLVRHIFVEIPLIMGEQFAKRIARTLGVTPICHRIARNKNIATWIIRYDRRGARPIRRIYRLLALDPSIINIKLERFTYEPKTESKKLA